VATYGEGDCLMALRGMTVAAKFWLEISATCVHGTAAQNRQAKTCWGFGGKVCSPVVISFPFPSAFSFSRHSVGCIAYGPNASAAGPASSYAALSGRVEGPEGNGGR
jgi:hypothetical protein